MGFVQDASRMGVRFRISLYCADRDTAERAFAAAFAELTRLEKIYSDFDPDSEVRRFDQQAPEHWVDVSSDLFQLTRRALEIQAQTDGYFDISLGTLTKLWRAARRDGQLPDPKILADAQRTSGGPRMKLDSASHRIWKLDGDFQLDFGGIAKGDAADQVLRLLRDQFAIDRVLIDAAGDLVAGNPPPGQPGWIVGLAQPEPARRRLDRIYLKNQALASSGDTTQFLEIDGRRWSHLLDPKTRQPSEGQNLTLVFAPDGATADALASALAVCPPAEFERLAAGFPQVFAARYYRRSADSPIQFYQTASWVDALAQIRVSGEATGH